MCSRDDDPTQHDAERIMREFAAYMGIGNVTPVSSEHCYDFPEVVVHAANGTCPRYQGGVCRPFPTPVKPYTEEEARIVLVYEELLGLGVVGVEVFPTGSTLYPSKGGAA